MTSSRIVDDSGSRSDRGTEGCHGCRAMTLEVEMR